MLYRVTFTKIFAEGNLAGIRLTDQRCPLSTYIDAVDEAEVFLYSIVAGKHFQDCITGNRYTVADVAIEDENGNLVARAAL